MRTVKEIRPRFEGKSSSGLFDSRVTLHQNVDKPGFWRVQRVGLSSSVRGKTALGRVPVLLASCEETSDTRKAGWLAPVLR